MTETLNPTKRLISLDALRGFTIAAMVIVNDPGSWSSVYDPLLHANWNGVTPTDLIFPFFLFMVGVSITLAYEKRKQQGASKPDMYKKILSRAVKIMLLGWFLWLWPDFSFEGMRYAGVLPRISLVFLACAVLFLNTNWKQQFWIGGGILLLYWMLFEWIPVPVDDVIQSALDTGTVQRSGGGIVELGEIERLSEGTIAANYQPGINIAAWFDRKVLPGRFWEVTWDPEGLLSTLPAIVTGIIGMLIGRLVLKVQNEWEKLTWIFFAGFAMYLLAEAWSWSMPLNKNLWTSSYTLWTAGMATMGLAACMLVVDLLGYTKWTGLGRVYGANAITSYVLAGMLTIIFYSDAVLGFAPNRAFMDGMTSIGMSAKLASFLYAIIYMLIIYIPALILYRKKIFIKV
ncbi:acyltransferase family protein [Fulvivirga sedimenti]|uniref:Heparan-alpha-glucosaminide N-acetyltransferase domain-containing protein n=1 Tax=Fulvivirga sedimenti TaxID=2879465 RepID=A0A9X1HUW2_9BACT|nr:heparan-alpha-glucosaminide N-acetyltransferase domain-containing protein [Fulvivirga sedimenti]MCA6078116.1 heparan-alpha-glucosaminide N-acetyltransferase domain-containing protein [Fulvivirga sedimenti]